MLPEKKKRGRKSKQELAEISLQKANDISQNSIVVSSTEVTPKVQKKRGRKPKGGKIIEVMKKTIVEPYHIPNIILHLKCKMSDLDNYSTTPITSYVFNKDLNYEYLPFNTETQTVCNKNISKNTDSEGTSEDNSDSLKQIWKKIESLSFHLHTNNIPDKKSACFWCTYDFENPPIFIPKYEINNSYYVYGCFCSLECACAHLIEENIDSATKFERYHLLNYIYGKIYNYEKNIKPAPNPYYTLNKYYGNLSIQEYRKLLKTERLLLIVDKPLSRQLPELHEDNDDYVINNNTISSNTRFQIKKNQKNTTKETILQDNFNLYTKN